MFCRQLYVDKYVSEHFHSIRRKFKDGKYPSGTFVIVLSKNSGRVEYYDCKAFKQKYYEQTGNYPLIIGLAQNMDSARNIVIKMIEEAVEQTGNADVKTYLKNKAETYQKSYFKKYDIKVIEQEGEK